MMIAYQRGTASIPDHVFPAIWRSSVIQGLNSQSRVIRSLCSGVAATGVVGSSKSVHLRCLLIHSGWLQKVYLTFGIPVVGQAALHCVYSPVKSLSVYSAVKWKPPSFVRPLPPPLFLAVAAVFVPLPFWVFILSNLVRHMVCLSLTLTSGSSKWDFLLGSTLFFAK